MTKYCYSPSTRAWKNGVIGPLSTWANNDYVFIDPNWDYVYNFLACDSQSQVQVTSLTLTQDNLSKPYSRTVTVIGTGSGNYQLKEGSTVIVARTLNNGFDQFTLDNISQGTHNYCAEAV